ncbi:TolC family protein [hot springs metagenome]|uniref:TolC family protein n=1 Tax=hot springs metagenome TaxID=433727 RepID=A0A5J4L6N2_9ZZZZ
MDNHHLTNNKEQETDNQELEARCKTRWSALIIIFFFTLVFTGNLYASENKSLTLKDCIDIALRQSPLIKTSEFDVEASHESYKASRGAILPRLDLNALYLKENQDLPYIPAQSTKIPAKFSDEIYSWNISLKIPVYEGGRLRGQINVSEIEKEIQKLKTDFTTQDVVANITNTFNKLLQLKELRTAYQKSVEALERQRNNTELLVNTGRAANIELLRTDVQLANEKQNLIRTEEAITRTRNTLAFLMGIQPSEINDISGSLDAKEKLNLVDVDESLKSRPDVASLIKKVEQTKIKIDIASAKRYPSVTIMGNYGSRAGTAVNGNEEVWETGVVVSLNIFDGGITSSEIKKERILHERAKEELRQAELRARVEIENALSLLQEARHRLEASQKAVAQSEEALRIEELKYKTGAGTITDALLAQSAMSLAQANYYQALYDYNAAITEYKRATGTIEVKR